MGHFAVYLFIAFVVLAVGFIVLSIRADRKRSEALGRIADEMGFKYASDPGEGFLSRYPSFHLFSQGRSPDVRNLLRGQAGGLEVSIFDYSYVTGHGKHRHTWRQTVLAFDIDDADLPAFSLRPETMFHKVGQWFGYKDIDFETHAEFSRKYLLRSSEEEAVRGLFDDRVLEYYESNPNVCTEGRGGRLVYYRALKRIDPSEVRTFLEEGFRVLALFRPPKEAT